MDGFLAVAYLVGIAYFVWSLATNHFPGMTRPGFIIGFGVFFALGFGAMGTRPLILRALAMSFGLLMSTHAFRVRRRQRQGTGAA